MRQIYIIEVWIDEIVSAGKCAASFYGQAFLQQLYEHGMTIFVKMRQPVKIPLTYEEKNNII